jgi:GT2 family glycosyltransferase
MIRRRVIEQVGLLDDGFFLYFEEVDLCLRAGREGWEVWYVPASRVVHLEGAATGIGAAEKRRPSYWFDSRRRFFVKHYGPGGLLAADVLWALGHASLGLRRFLRLGSGGVTVDPPGMAADLLVGDLRAAWKGDLPARSVG